MRVMNVLLYPTRNSVMFWDAFVLSGYLVLNIIIGWVVLGSDKKGIAPRNGLNPLYTFQ